MKNCAECNKKLSYKNIYGYCLKHKHLSLEFKAIKKQYDKKTYEANKNNKEYKLKKKNSVDQYQTKNKDRIREKQKNNPKYKVYQKVYQIKNKDKIYTYTKEWRKQNSEKVKKYYKKNYQKMMATPHGSLTRRMGTAIRNTLVAGKNGRSWESLLGYTRQQLKDHLESLFTEGMSWEVFLQGKIHIDHKIPKSLFKYTSFEDEEFKKCWALSNLQPLWSVDNFKKGNKI